MKLAMLSGSFHAKSRSIAILNSLEEYFPDHEFYIPRLDYLPFYCEDLSRDKPERVVALIDRIESSDGVIVCTPEYNHSVPAVLKNAIDWASRPAFNSILKAKPISIITQASSPVGGARAQAHLKLIFDSTLALVHPCREMMITNIDQVIDDSFKITDPEVENKLRQHLSAFFNFVQCGP